MPKFRIGELVAIYSPGHPEHKTKAQIREIVPGKMQSFYKVRTAPGADFIFEERDLVDLKKLGQNSDGSDAQLASFVERLN